MRVTKCLLLFILLAFFASCDPVFAQGKPEPKPSAIQLKMQEAEKAYAHDDTLITEYTKAIEQLKAHQQYLTGYYQALQQVAAPDTSKPEARAK